MGYQVPKLAIDVSIFLNDGTEMDGQVFITESLVSYTGTPRLEDFLEKVERFFPFHQTEGDTFLISKHLLVYLRSSEKDSEMLERDLMLKPQPITVRLENGHDLSGSIYSMLPKEIGRVSDYLNQGKTFLSIYQEEDKIIINTDRVVWAQDKHR